MLFLQARLQLARLRLRAGQVDQAATHLGLMASPSADTKSLESATKAAQKAIEAARKAQEGQKWQRCIDQSNKAIEVVSQNADLRQLRADCALEMGNLDDGTADLTYAGLSWLVYIH